MVPVCCSVLMPTAAHVCLWDQKRGRNFISPHNLNNKANNVLESTSPTCQNCRTDITLPFCFIAYTSAFALSIWGLCATTCEMIEVMVLTSWLFLQRRLKLLEFWDLQTKRLSLCFYSFINLNMTMINTSQLASLNDLITHCTDPLSSSPSSLTDVAEDLSDRPNSASTISGVRRRSELPDLPERSNHHESVNAVTNNQRRGVIEAVANLYLHSSLNLVSDAVGQILKSWRSLYRQ